MTEYIERDALIDAMQAYQYDAGKDGFAIMALIGIQPAADVAPVVHGRWIEKSAPARKIYFECSHCGAQENKHTAIKGYYCWRCGARMDGDGNALN